MVLNHNVDLLVLQGEAQYYSGDYKQAQMALERVRFHLH